MEFRKWFEDVSSTEYRGRRKQQITNLAKRFFGKPDTVVDQDEFYDLDWVLPNGREFGISWQLSDMYFQKETISISFEQYSDADPSEKELGTIGGNFDTKKNLQPGSLNFSKKLFAFVKELKKLGIAINYSTAGRRRHVYDKMLRKANFTPLAQTNSKQFMPSFWWEAMDPVSTALAQRKQQILGICEKYFGEPAIIRKGSNEHLPYQMVWDLPRGRNLVILWVKREINTEKEALNIDFDQGNTGEEVSDKNSGYNTNKQLQPGSMDFVKTLYAFVKEIKSLGIAITYTTGGKRKSLYDKYLNKAGFNSIFSTEEPFYQSVWENSTMDVDQTSQRLQQIIDIGTKYFGKPWKVYSHNLPIEVFWDLPQGRELDIVYSNKEYYTSKETITISFDQSTDQKLSNKNQEFSTAKQLQPGSIDFVKNLYAFVKDIKSIGIAIKYGTAGKRKHLYDKYLKKANFNQAFGTSKPFGSAVWEGNQNDFS